ncbi:MAG: hypothetical protein ACT4OO_06845 [Nitrospiraceae bacterium]
MRWRSVQERKMSDMARATEIASDHYAISIYVPEFNRGADGPEDISHVRR